MNSPELDEVLRKIGRNVLVLQRIEAMLKHLIPRSHIEGDINTIKSNQDKAINALSRQTMGNLVKRFIENICEERSSPREEIESSEMLSFSLKITLDDEVYVSKKEALECVVAERNKLIHHMLSSFNQSSMESCAALQIELDEQYKLINSEYKFLKDLVLNLQSVTEHALREVEQELIPKNKNA